MISTVLRGREKEVEIEPDGPTVFIGERCNALAYKIVRQSVDAGNLDVIVERAKVQCAAGAAAVNVNMVGTSQPEEELLPKMVELIAAEVDIPLSIDFGTLKALEAGLKAAPGRALVNSVSGEAQKLDPVLELAKRYDAAVIAIACGEGGIPKTARARADVFNTILEHAKQFDMGLDDIIADAICLGVATEPDAGLVTFETCRLFRQEFGLNIALGSSNAAFGMPKRKVLNAYYLAMAIGAGMNVALSDPVLSEFQWAARAADCCLGKDEFGAQYIRTYREEAKAAKQAQEAAVTA